MTQENQSTKIKLKPALAEWQFVVRPFLLVFALCSIILLIGAIPARLAQLQTVCMDVVCPALILVPADFVVLQQWGFSALAYAVYHTAIELILIIPVAILWIVLFRRYAENRVGLLACLGLVYLGIGLGNIVWAWTQESELAATAGDVIGEIGATALILLLFLFPDGRFVPRWTRYPAYFLLFVFLPLGVINLILSPGLDGNLPDTINSMVFLVYILLGTSGQIMRYRRYSTRLLRQQTKWVVLGFVALMCSIVLWFLFMELFPLPPGRARLTWNIIGGSVMFSLSALFPISLGLAIVYSSLWDIDLLINRTLVYGVLTVLITAVYTLLVGGIGSLAVTEQGHLAAFAVATAIVLVGIRPLHGRLQKRMDDLLPPRKPVINSEVTRRTTRLHLMRAAWGLNTLLALMLFAAGFMIQMKHGFWQQPPAEAMTAIPALAGGLVQNSFFQAGGIYFLVLIPAYIQAAAFVAVGLLLFWRKSRDVMGILASWVLIAIGLGFTPTILFLPLLAPAWHLPTSLFQASLFGSVFLFLCLFPNGRFFPRWSRSAAVVWLGFVLLWLPFPQLNLHRATTIWPPLIFAAVVFLGIGFQVIRYHRLSEPDEKQQTKWVIAGFAAANFSLFGIVVLLGLGVIQTTIYLGAVMILLGMASTLIPLTISIALFRYRLWDIDIIINRTLVYGGLSLGIVIIYVLVVGALGLLFQSQDSFLIALLATGLIAILFQPVRDRLQHGVNRLMFGERDDPYAVLSKLGAQLQTTAAPAAMLQSVVETIAATLKLPFVAIKLADEQGQLGGAATGKAVAETADFPLRYQNETVGHMVVSPRSPGESFTEQEEQLLADIAGQTGAMAYAVRLTAALQRSREKLVLAREEERRRIRRDLHDELGPTLASQTFAFDAILEMLGTDEPEAARLLRELKSQNQETVAEIRRLVHELRPPALDELGLVGALQAHVGQLSGRSTLPIQIQANPDPLPPLSAAVEVAAYRITLEAITNAVRHARAQRCKVQLVANGRSQLQVSISDDGIGLPPEPKPGVGMQSMRERAEELGGSFVVAKQTKGTRVTAVLPLSRPSEPERP